MNFLCTDPPQLLGRKSLFALSAVVDRLIVFLDVDLVSAGKSDFRGENETVAECANLSTTPETALRWKASLIWWLGCS
jgi:hypothetical protein